MAITPRMDGLLQLTPTTNQHSYLHILHYRTHHHSLHHYQKNKRTTRHTLSPTLVRDMVHHPYELYHTHLLPCTHHCTLHPRSHRHKHPTLTLSLQSPKKNSSHHWHTHRSIHYHYHYNTRLPPL